MHRITLTEDQARPIVDGIPAVLLAPDGTRIGTVIRDPSPAEIAEMKRRGRRREGGHTTAEVIEYVERLHAAKESA